MLAQRPCAAGQDGRKTKNRPGPVCLIGRGGGIRTRDPLHPMQVRYQAALRPDNPRIIPETLGNQRRNISITYCNSARRPPTVFGIS